MHQFFIKIRINKIKSYLDNKNKSFYIIICLIRFLITFIFFYKNYFFYIINLINSEIIINFNIK
jgi:hypothetical protein